MSPEAYQILAIAAVLIIVGLIINGWLTVECPKCGSAMDYGTYGYDRHECLNCGHHQK